MLDRAVSFRNRVDKLVGIIGGQILRLNRPPSLSHLITGRYHH